MLVDCDGQVEPGEQGMAASTTIDPATRAYQTVTPATGELVRAGIDAFANLKVYGLG
jgi:hypothetical protein